MRLQKTSHKVPIDLRRQSDLQVLEGCFRERDQILSMIIPSIKFINVEVFLVTRLEKTSHKVPKDLKTETRSSSMNIML